MFPLNTFESVINKRIIGLTLNLIQSASQANRGRDTNIGFRTFLLGAQREYT